MTRDIWLHIFQRSWGSMYKGTWWCSPMVTQRSTEHLHNLLVNVFQTVDIIFCIWHLLDGGIQRYQISPHGVYTTRKVYFNNAKNWVKSWFYTLETLNKFKDSYKWLLRWFATAKVQQILGTDPSMHLLTSLLTFFCITNPSGVMLIFCMFGRWIGNWPNFLK